MFYDFCQVKEGEEEKAEAFWSCNSYVAGGYDQVWPLTRSLFVYFLRKVIDLPARPTNFAVVCSFQQRTSLFLFLAFLIWHGWWLNLVARKQLPQLNINRAKGVSTRQSNAKLGCVFLTWKYSPFKMMIILCLKSYWASNQTWLQPAKGFRDADPRDVALRDGWTSSQPSLLLGSPTLGLCSRHHSAQRDLYVGIR